MGCRRMQFEEQLTPAAAKVAVKASIKTGSTKSWIRSWILAFCLPMTVVVLLQIGYSLAIARHLGTLSIVRATSTILLFIPESIGRRLINDADDYRRGVDSADNARPGSALAQGLPMKQVRAVGLTCFAIAVAWITYLLYTTSPPSVVIAPLALITLIYSGGPAPLGYRGLGEVVDFVFTGCLVTGTVIWVNVHRMTLAVVLGAMAAGFLFAATMFHNNLRDITVDRRAGKRTLAHALSPRSAKVLYAVLIFAPYLCVLAIAIQFQSLRSAAPLLSLPYALYIATQVVRAEFGSDMPSWSHMPRLLISFFGLFVLAAWI